MSKLITPKPKLKRFRTQPTGEVTTHVWDVYRIMRGFGHTRVYTGYADFDYAMQIKNELQTKCGDKCYLVGRKIKRMVRKRNGFT